MFRMSLTVCCLQEQVKEKASIEDAKKATPEEDPKGIPEFWLTIFKSVDMLSDMLQVCVGFFSLLLMLTFTDMV